MKRGNKSWLWYFGTVIALSGLAMFLLSKYLRELAPVLTKDELEAARQKWEQQGPTHYRMTYEVLIDDARTKDEHVVDVKDGKIVQATWNDKDLATLDEKALANAFSVGQLFNLLEENLASKRYTATAYFNKELGYPSRYVRRERGTRARLEIRVVKLTPIVSNK